MRPITITCPCFMGMSWLIYKGNPTLPLVLPSSFWVLEEGLAWYSLPLWTAPVFSSFQIT